MKSKALSKNDQLSKIKKIAISKNGLCLSNEYRNFITDLKFRCSEGHIFWSKPPTILRGSWCPTCAIVIQHNKQRTPFSKIEELAKRNPGLLLTNEDDYHRDGGRVVIVCDNGHITEVSSRHIKMGRWCHTCAVQRRTNGKRHSIDTIMKVAKARGGRLISEQYLKNDQKLVWECFAGHKFEAVFSNVKKGTWCPKCSKYGSISERVVRKFCETLMGIELPSVRPSWLRNIDGNILELDGFNEKFKFAFEHHGTQHYFESEHYKGDAFKKRVRDDTRKEDLCRKNGIRLLIVNQLFQKTDLAELRSMIISFCKKNHLPLVDDAESVEIEINSVYKINPIQRYAEICRVLGGECISKQFSGYKTKLIVRCKDGHTWGILPGKLVSGQWCPDCMALKMAAINTRHTIEEMQAWAEANGGKCLSDKYISFSEKLEWECSSGHRWTANPSNISLGKWCRICSQKKVADRNRGNLDKYLKIAKSKGGNCLSEEYVNARTKLKWICEKEHIWEATPDAIRSGSWCKLCASQRRNRGHK